MNGAKEMLGSRKKEPVMHESLRGNPLHHAEGSPKMGLIAGSRSGEVLAEASKPNLHAASAMVSVEHSREFPPQAQRS